MTVQTAIQVVGEDVVGSLQCAPSMESMSDPALTSLLNFRTTSSESQPPSRMPKERRRRGQRDDCASAERRDEALERPLPPIRLRLLFWIDARTERHGEAAAVWHESTRRLTNRMPRRKRPSLGHQRCAADNVWSSHRSYLTPSACLLTEPSTPAITCGAHAVPMPMVTVMSGLIIAESRVRVRASASWAIMQRCATRRVVVARIVSGTLGAPSHRAKQPYHHVWCPCRAHADDHCHERPHHRRKPS